MQKLPGGHWQEKRNDACVKKKGKLLTRGTGFLSLSSSDQRFDNTILLSGVLGATHTSLDVALVSPFHPVAALSRLIVCRNIKDYEMELQTKTTRLWQTSQKKLTLMEALNTKWGLAYARNDYRIFDTLTRGFNHFNCIQEKLPHLWNGCWTQEIKENIKKKNVFVSDLLLSSFV